MSNALHEVGRPLGGHDSLASMRAQEVGAAVAEHPEFQLHEVRRLESDSSRADVFIVTCACEGVPERNPVGIRYREPLAIVVPEDARVVPAVLSLRKDFPVTPHQNNVLDGEPANLCLYEQPPASVLRTWTAPAFLTQVSRWLADTAHQRLHGTDQPVEQLFFESPHDVVVPAGYLTAPSASPPALVLTKVVERRHLGRPEPSLCLFLEPVAEGQQVGKSIRCVCITLAPIVHGAVEREPSTLGGLEDQLRARGSAILEPLLGHIRAHVGDGITAEDHYAATLLLLVTPIRRRPDGDIERVQARAFWIAADMLKIGVDAGVLRRTIVLPPHYFCSGSTDVEQAWRAHAVVPLSVRQRPDREMARLVSGTSNAGPRAVLAGAGALGSTLLGLWRRAGWGSWDVIDPDNMKPHNLIRHTSHAIGYAKADAVARSDAQLWHQNVPEIGAIIADAANLSQPEVREALEQAELVVDATTQLEVPRHYARVDRLQRVISCFLTPSGTDSVLIAEGATRRERIDALEAQYYRAVVTQPWGERHLAASEPTFRSGVSCRDVSVTLPYSRIVAHAATLAEQIQNLSAEPQIRVWQRAQASGEVTVHDVPVHQPLVQPLYDMEVVWDRATLQKVRRLRESALPAETGGVLIGYHDFNERRIFVVDALAAPPDSIGSPAGFERGVKGLAAQLAVIGKRSAGQVTYLGEWHSHPRGCPAIESTADLWQLLYLGNHLKRDGLPALMLIIGEQDEQWLMAK